MQHSIEEALCVLRAAVGLTPLYFVGSVPLDARVPHLHRVKAPFFFNKNKKTTRLDVEFYVKENTFSWCSE